MKEKTYQTAEEVLTTGRELIGIPLKDIDTTGRITKGKGAIGNIIEESWFKIKVNNRPEPDFKLAGVELKVTPYIKTRNGVSAKERLVCNIIDYMEEYKRTFRSSSFWCKNNNLLILSYEHRYDVGSEDYVIDEALLYKFPVEDLIIIEKDWELIIYKVRTGKAHELSEGDTLYLGACTKGANAKSLRKQPFSDILAKQRAYCLKQSYMTYILRNYIYGDKTDEKIIKNSAELKELGFEEYIIHKISPYLGKKQDSLKEMFKIQSSPKNLNELILSNILGIKGRISNTEEFMKANIVPKTIRIEQNGTIKENMSFPTFKFKELVNEEWETSKFKNYLEQTKFLFVIFRFDENDNLVFDDLMFWSIPDKDIDKVQIVWQKTVNAIRKGVELEVKNGKIHNNLPKHSESDIAHIRPHASSATDTYELPDGRTMPKQCFWLNNTYIKSQIDNMKSKHKY